jgi:cellulose synthase operon protein C
MASAAPKALSGSNPSARLRLVWGLPPSAPAPWRLGVVCFYRLAKSSKTGEYYVPKINDSGRYALNLLISVRGLLYWGFALLLMAHFAGAGVIYARYKAKPHNLVTYSDLVLPWRWSGVSALRGQAQLNQAKEDFKAYRVGEAFGGLRAGLVRYPQDQAARLQLATIFILSFRRDLADNVLFEGLNYGPPTKEFLSGALVFLKDSDHPERLLEFCQKARALVTAEDPERVSKLHVLDAANVDVLVALGRHAEAVKVAESIAPPDVDLVFRTRMLAAFAAKDPAGAVAVVNAWMQARPKSEVALATAVDVHRKANQLQEMDSLLVRLRKLNPANASFTTMAVVQNLLAGRDAEARAALDDCILRFGSYAETLNTLSSDIGTTGRIELLAELESVMQEHGFDLQDLLASRLLAQIDHADWAGATITQQALAEREKKLRPEVQVLEKTAASLITVCAYDTPAAKIVLCDYLRRYPGRLPLYIKMIDRLIGAERWSAAHDVVSIAERIYPSSVQLLARNQQIAPQLTRIDSQETADSKQEMATRVANTTDLYANADSFLSALEQERAKSDFESALRLIQRLRQNAPAWLPTEVDKIDRSELDLALSLGDILQLQSVVRGYLRYDEKPERYDVVCTLAEQCWRDTNKSAAELLVREVLRRKPEQARAAGLLKAWQPKPGKETP